MAKNISLLGADYPDVPAVVLPKTGGGTAKFVDPDEMAWETVTLQNNQTEQSVNSKYTEIFIEGTFSAGQKLLFHGPLGTNAQSIRQDTGFYYSASACGSGVVMFYAHSVQIYKPYYGGSETTFSSIKAWAR